MFKFLKKHPPKDSSERESLKKELFGFRRCVDHGFPSKPTALAYDPKLRLLAVGNRNGVVKVLGAPGVEFDGIHKEDVAVNELFFLPEQGRLITHCSDNSLHLWEINVREGLSVLEEVQEFSMESNKLKSISACSLTIDAEHLLMGTEGGNIHLLDVKTFQLIEPIIYQDVVMQNVPDDFKVNPGAVESIAVHPLDSNKFLIGYNRGLIVLWDNKDGSAEQTYNATQQLESLAWHSNGEEFKSAHSDGSYIIWSGTDSTNPKEPALTPYGPFPCKSISKLQWKTAKSDPFIIFSGGMPRASYGDRHTISIMQGSNHVVLDFTSKVVDFITVTRADESEGESGEYDEPHSVIVLVEEELVVIDLLSENWPAFRIPYMNSLHCSAITCSQHVSNVPNNLWDKIEDAGAAQMRNLSHRDWPINGGLNTAKETTTKDLLLTGHEDGTVRFWDASTTSMKMLYKLSTATIFSVDVPHPEQNSVEEEEWPPFKKVGNFDPYSDDPRLGIQKIALCPLSETLVIAGTAGQIMVMQMDREERELEIKPVTINIVGDRDGFVWKGHQALEGREGDVKFAIGYQPTSLMQLSPPAACTALAFHSEWCLLGAGTAHGFAVFDYLQKKEVTSRCTLNPSGTSDTPMSRRKSLKKSLRESFRRLRRRRSERRRTAEDKSKTGIEQSPKAEKGATGGSASPATPRGTTPSPEHRPVERQVEARPADDSISSMVRSLYFADTFVVHGSTNPSLWVGTNGGHVYIYNMTVQSDKRSTEGVTCVLAKEIKLRHRAPVISIAVIDGRSRVLPEPLEVLNERVKAPDNSSPHSVVICSEEQIKIFSLPHLKAKWKCKLTAVDGSRLRKVAFVNFRSRSDENYTEFDLACLSNLGNLSVYSLTTLRQQLVASALRREDINGITSFVFTKYGQGFYLMSASEFTRVTLSARYIMEPRCVLTLKEGMRLDPEPEPEPTAPEVEVSPEQTGATEAQVERTEAEGDAEEGGRLEYGSGDIADALNETANDSRADTTIEGEITQDSIRVIETSVVETSPSENLTETTTTSTTVEHSSSEQTTTEQSTTITTQSGGVTISNVDDDTKATKSIEVETKVASERLVELKITEDGDEVISKMAAQQSDIQTEVVPAS
ncbi:hypothetical protein ScPMuIL_005029 [Solemya velum]